MKIHKEKSGEIVEIKGLNGRTRRYEITRTICNIDGVNFEFDFGLRKRRDGVLFGKEKLVRQTNTKTGKIVVV